MDSSDTNSQPLSREETLILRGNHIAGACQLHFNRNPLKVVRAKGQYVFDDEGQKYLDCVSRINNVGHCHPAIVEAACRQMATLTVASHNVADLETCYHKQLLSTLPDNFEVCLFANSGAEANDLALQLAKNFTKRRDIVVVEGSFHGSVNSLLDICPKAFNKSRSGKKTWAHVIPCPDTYRGAYRDKDSAAQYYFEDAKALIDDAIRNSGPIACFISEPVFIVYGVVVPPSAWLEKIYSYIREVGGLVIADEIQTGLGRCGSHFWSFQAMDAIPDIITIGKPIGNGYPFSGVITSHKIASCLKGQYNCGPLAASIGLSVLNILHEDALLQNTKIMGKLLKEELLSIKKNHKHIGDIRGLGLMIGVDIVWCQQSRKPASEIAEKISYRLKEDGIIIANEGEHSNVLVLMPPLCICEADIRSIVSTLDKILQEVEVVDSQDIYNILNSTHPESSQEEYQISWSEKNLLLVSDSDDSDCSIHYDSMD